MNYAGILTLFFGILSLRIPASHSIEVNLTDTRQATTDLNWLTEPNDGTGWIELSNPDENGDPLRTFQVCNLKYPDRRSWFRTNYIQLDADVNEIYVEVKFNIMPCIGFSEYSTCKETFNLFYLAASSEDSETQELNENVYTKVDTVAGDRFINSPKDAASVETRRIPVSKANGVYIAFQDTGACMVVYYVRVYHKKCDKTIQNLVQYPDSTTGGGAASLVKVSGKCVDNAIRDENDADPSLHCNGEGEWRLPEGSCKCLPGYSPNRDMTACLECPPGTYKSTAGNGICLPCPQNRISTKRGSSSCRCRAGFYHSYKDKPSTPCTRPPTRPEVVEYVVKETAVDVKWSQPNDSGGRKDVYYRISCQRCDSTYTLCSECDDGIDYDPAGRFLIQPKVSIRGLSPHTYYRFRIHSFNGVTKASGEDPAYTDAMLKTSEAAPSAVPIVRVIKRRSSEILVNWEAPESPHGDVTEYEIHYSSKDKSRPRISRFNTTNTQSFWIRSLPPRTSFTIQVRARNGAGYGPFSSPVVAATTREPPSIFRKPANLGNSPMFNNHDDMTSLDDVTEDEKDMLPVALVIAMCSAFIIAAMAAMLVIWAKRRREQKFGCDNVEVYPFFDNAADLLNAHREPRSYVDPTLYGNPDQAVLEFTREIDAFNVKKDELMGSGEFGNVYKGYLRPTSFICDGTISTTTSMRTNQHKVAVKVLKDDASLEQRQEFLEEALVMAQFHHPNVIRLEGVVTRTTPLMIVTEFMENGSLDKLLENHRQRGIELEVFQLVSMLRDIADGMKYLSDMGYVHRDLAARNILVNDQLVCKVSDFGLSRVLENVDDEEAAVYKTKSGLVPIRWTSPEAVTQRTFTSASDVWSYGIILWEVLTHGERPYWDMTNQDVVHCIECGYRLPPPSFCPRVLHNLMLNCWNLDRTRRPTFRQIVSQLDNLLITPERLQDTINNIPPHEQPPGVPESLDISSLVQWLEDMNMLLYKDIMLRNGCVTAEQIIRLTPNQLDEMGIVDPQMQNILLNGAEYLRQKLQAVNIIGIGITV